MGKPSFIIVGAERCGTTSLYYNLCKHSLIREAYTKEIHYFDMHYDNGPEWYHLQFDTIEGTISGEATPTYFWNPRAARRIYRYNPKMKIIITLRDKDEAIKSKFRQQVKKGVEHLTFEEALKVESIRIDGEIERVNSLPYNYYPALYSEFAYADRYNYEKHLKNWEMFDKLIITDYFTKTNKRLNQCFEFLGLQPEVHEWEILNKGI